MPYNRNASVRVMKDFIKMNICSGSLFCHIKLQWAIEYVPSKIFILILSNFCWPLNEDFIPLLFDIF